MSDELELNVEKHVAYFLYHLKSLPAPYSALDTTRMTVLYFCVSGLDMLEALDRWAVFFIFRDPYIFRTGLVLQTDVFKKLWCTIWLYWRKQLIACEFANTFVSTV